MVSGELSPDYGETPFKRLLYMYVQISEEASRFPRALSGVAHVNYPPCAHPSTPPPHLTLPVPLFPFCFHTATFYGELPFPDGFPPHGPPIGTPI